MLKRIANTSRKISRIPGRSVYTMSVPQYSSTGEYEGEGLIENKSIKHNMLHDYEMEKGDPVLVQHTDDPYLTKGAIRHPLPWLPRFQRIRGEDFKDDDIHTIKDILRYMKRYNAKYKTPHIYSSPIENRDIYSTKELKDYYKLGAKDMDRRIEAWEKILKYAEDEEKKFPELRRQYLDKTRKGEYKDPRPWLPLYNPWVKDGLHGEYYVPNGTQNTIKKLLKYMKWIKYPKFLEEYKGNKGDWDVDELENFYSLNPNDQKKRINAWEDILQIIESETAYKLRQNVAKYEANMEYRAKKEKIKQNYDDLLTRTSLGQSSFNELKGGRLRRKRVTRRRGSNK